MRYTLHGLPWNLTRTCLFATVAIAITVFTLWQYSRDRYVPTHALKASSVYQHDRAIRIFCEALGTDPELPACTRDVISRVLVELRSSQGDRTRARVRTAVLSVLRDAAEYGLIDSVPHVKGVKRRPIVPTAWTVDQVRELLTATRYLPRHGDYMHGFIRADWDTGLRKEDVERIEQPNGSTKVVVYQEKTGDPVLILLRSATVEALQKLPGKFPLRWPISKSQSYYWWKKLCKLARVPHGGPQRLRRSAATNVELHHPGAATHFLGHRSADLARKHYLDPRILQRSLFQPEEL